MSAEKASRLRPEFPVYRWSFKDWTTMVVAGPSREHLWWYVHDVTPTVLRLRRPVVRFLLDSMADVGDWLARSRAERGSVVWTLPPNEGLYPGCVLIASDDRAWLQVFTRSPSVVRVTELTVEFLVEVLADLPAASVNLAARSVAQNAVVPPRVRLWGGQLWPVAR